jgi:hypothetical protein
MVEVGLWVGCLVGWGAHAKARGACSEGGWQAHSVRRESCNADSSPEPSAACSEGGVCGQGSFDLRVRRGVPLAR